MLRDLLVLTENTNVYKNPSTEVKPCYTFKKYTSTLLLPFSYGYFTQTTFLQKYTPYYTF